MSEEKGRSMIEQYFHSILLFRIKRLKDRLRAHAVSPLRKVSAALEKVKAADFVHVRFPDRQAVGKRKERKVMFTSKSCDFTIRSKEIIFAQPKRPLAPVLCG